MSANAENKTTALFWGIDGAPRTKSFVKKRLTRFLIF